MPIVIRNIIRFFLLLLLQVLILNNLENLGLANSFILPQIYILFILLLPFETPTWISICLGFLIGLLVDFSIDTEGLHAFASTSIAYLKPRLTKSLSPRDGYDFNSEPNLRDQGLNWFLVYGSILIFTHHFLLFFLEKLAWSNFFSTLLTIVLSAAFSLILAMIYQFIVYQKKR